MVVWKMCYPAHIGNKVSCGVSGIVHLDECVCSMAMCMLCVRDVRWPIYSWCP